MTKFPECRPLKVNSIVPKLPDFDIGLKIKSPDKDKVSSPNQGSFSWFKRLAVIVKSKFKLGLRVEDARVSFEKPKFDIERFG